MPELPEVEIVRIGLVQLEGAIINKIIVRRRNLRYLVPKNIEIQLINNQLDCVTRVAKYLLLKFNNGIHVVIHLGMSGQCLINTHINNKFTKHDHLIINWQWPAGKVRQLVYRDYRRFGYWKLLQDPLNHAPFNSLGLEAILTEGTADFARNRGEFDSDYLFAQFSRRRQSVKQVLLNQQIIGGLGNIYTLESLWDAGIHPDSLSSSIPLSCVDKLTKSIKKILNLSIKAGGSTLQSFVNVKGYQGYFQHKWQVYQRAGKICSLCGATIDIKRKNGRSSFFCPKHQVIYC